ncbi:MAG: hypothetical protein QNK37_19180 [Acidobacteriota bacterium]|nr:hypothetical protein [Acidobacteriota bacterium]
MTRLSMILPVALMAALFIQAGESDSLAATRPSYELDLSLAELSIYHAAAISGVSKHGGEAEFRQTLYQQNGETRCRLTIENPQLFKVWNFWLAERSHQLVVAADLNNPRADVKLALQLIQSIHAKLEKAEANPIWEMTSIAGRLLKRDGKLWLDDPRGRFSLTAANELESLVGESLRIEGVVKQRATLEVASYSAYPEDTLEVYVMSVCPYARKAEHALLDYLAANPGKAPNLSVRYIFFKDPKQPDAPFISMKGAAEIEENLVQMIIRDQYPELFHAYLMERAADDGPWRQLAGKLGMDRSTVKGIADTIAQEGELLIAQEYAYVAGERGIRDGSPSFTWRGEVVTELNRLEPFRDFSLSDASCNGGIMQ